MKREYSTPTEVANKLGRHPETIRQWLREGKISGWQVVPRGSWMISADEVERLRNRIVPTKEAHDDE